MTGILIIKLGAFGDIFQAEGALRDLRAHHAGAVITVLTAPPYRALMERCPWVDRVWIDPRAPRWRLDRMLALRARLRAGGFDRVYDFQHVARTDFYFRWFLPEVDWAGSARGCAFPLRHPHPHAIPSLTRLADQLADAGVPVRHALDPDLSWMADPVDDLLRAAGLSASAGKGPRETGPRETGYVVLLPGSSARHPAKRWPHYAALARDLAARGHDVVTVPGPDDMQVCRSLPGTMLTAASRPLDFFGLAGVLKRARLVVGNDSGPTHLAAHLGVPGLALFGAGTPAGLTGIARPNMTVLTATPLAALSPDAVLEAALARLA
jgi:ADP-heptose:LPS heptosyltransferase